MDGVAYDEGQFAAIRTIVADTEKAVYAAKTVADAEAAFLAGYEKFDAVPTKNEHAAMFLYGGALYTDYTAAVKEINAYVDYKLSMLTNTEKDNEIYDATKIKIALEDLLKEAYTADELKEKVTEAKVAVDGLKTKADALAKKTELEAAVNALPKTVAVENKAAIQAAYDAISEWNEEYCDAFMATAKVATYKALTGTITAYKETVKKLEADALLKTYKALADKNTAKTLTAADKAEVTKLAEDFDAFVASWTDETSTYGEKEGYNYNGLNAANIKALKNAVAVCEADDVAKEIMALPAKVTDENLEQVKAVIAKYDALDDLAKSKLGGYAYEKLSSLKQQISVVDTLDADGVKAYVFDQTIKATSVKLGAKKVKVTANFDASKLIENGYTVEYKFYKSTKKSSGYKYTVTKSSDNATYTNTNAKKGKNYYKFKVVVKNADGTVILTTALKDCKYACRTIK